MEKILVRGKFDFQPKRLSCCRLLLEGYHSFDLVKQNFFYLNRYPIKGKAKS